jgi:hypothetical protein
MSEYPKQDKKVILCTSDNSRIAGSINIVGRRIFAYLEDSDPDIVLYDTNTEDGKAHKTLLVPKSQVYWIDPVDDTGREQDVGKWMKVTFKLANGQVITGEVDIAGFNRTSDYFRAYPKRFYEVYECSVIDKKYAVLFVASEHVLWKEPLD